MLQAQNLQPSVNNGRMLNMLVYVKFFKVDGFQYECIVNGFYFEIEVMVDTQIVACLIPQNVSFTHTLFTHSCGTIRPCKHQLPSS